MRDKNNTLTVVITVSQNQNRLRCSTSFLLARVKFLTWVPFSNKNSGTLNYFSKFSYKKSLCLWLGSLFLSLRKSSILVVVESFWRLSRDVNHEDLAFCKPLVVISFFVISRASKDLQDTINMLFIKFRYNHFSTRWENK